MKKDYHLTPGVLFRIPHGLREKLKARAIAENTCLTKLMVKLLEEAMNENNE
jgi:hypothetical protein